MIVNLLNAAGMVSGLGDWRIEKGSGNYGTYGIVNPDDPRFLKVVSEGNRESQIKAMEDPEPYDHETEELLQWFDGEVNRRGLKAV